MTPGILLSAITRFSYPAIDGRTACKQYNDQWHIPVIRDNLPRSSMPGKDADREIIMRSPKIFHEDHLKDGVGLGQKRKQGHTGL
jgi:hypothetical protein